MDIVVWMLAGGVVGWASYSFLRFNRGHSIHLSILVGAVGALLGGKLVAPMLSLAAVAPGDFRTSSGLLFAAAVAAALLALGNLLQPAR